MTPLGTQAVGAGVASAAAPSTAARFAAELIGDVEAFLARCEKLLTPDSSPFHSLHWLRAWYASLGSADGRQPVLVAVTCADTGADVMLLPLSASRRRGLSIVQFADASVCDYTGPIVAAAWVGRWASSDRGSANLPHLWQAMRTALRGHDVLLLEKLMGQALHEGGNAPNPLLAVLRPRTCPMFGSEFSAPQDWESWRRSLDKRVRKEFERSWRVFSRSAEARFERITDPERAAALFTELETQQSLRMRPLVKSYVLDDAPYRDFYRRALAAGLTDNSVVLTALIDGPDVVAVQFGIANRARYIALRQSLNGDRWKNCSPGRLLDERTAHHLHEAGYKHFDFGIGDYFHKDTFQVTRIPLFDACESLSWRGGWFVAAWRLKYAAKKRPWLVRWVRKLRPG